MRMRRSTRIISHVLIILTIFAVSLPVLLALTISTQSPAEVYSSPPRILPSTHLSNYPDAWNSVKLGRLLFNSFVVSIAVTVGKIILSLLAGFAFTHFEFRGKNLLFFLVLVTLLLPIPVRIVALFAVVSSAHWIDTYWGLIFPFLASATGTFLLLQRFRMIPHELLDAAKIDGCSPMRYLAQILVPLSANSIGALTVIEFIYVWNQYLWPLMATNSDSMRVVQIGIKMMITAEAMNNWGIIMAGVMVTIIPPLAIFYMMQGSFMKGFALASEK